MSVVYGPETSRYLMSWIVYVLRDIFLMFLEEEATDHLQVSGVEIGTMEYGFP